MIQVTAILAAIRSITAPLAHPHLPTIHHLGLSSCTRPEADYKSDLPGGLSSCTRPEADYKSALPRGLSWCTGPEADYKSALPGGFLSETFKFLG